MNKNDLKNVRNLSCLHGTCLSLELAVLSNIFSY